MNKLLKSIIVLLILFTKLQSEEIKSLDSIKVKMILDYMKKDNTIKMNFCNKNKFYPLVHNKSPYINYTLSSNELDSINTILKNEFKYNNDQIINFNKQFNKDNITYKSQAEYWYKKNNTKYKIPYNNINRRKYDARIEMTLIDKNIYLVRLTRSESKSNNTKILLNIFYIDNSVRVLKQLYYTQKNAVCGG